MATRPAKINVWNWCAVLSQFRNGTHGADLVRKKRALQFCAVHGAANHALLVYGRMDDSLQNACLEIGNILFGQQINHLIGILLLRGIPHARGNLVAGVAKNLIWHAFNQNLDQTLPRRNAARIRRVIITNYHYGTRR